MGLPSCWLHGRGESLSLSLSLSQTRPLTDTGHAHVTRAETQASSYNLVLFDQG